MQVKRGTYKDSGESRTPLGQRKAGTSRSSRSLVTCPQRCLAGWRGSCRPSRPRSRPAATCSSRDPQLRHRWLPRGPCPAQGPSCSSRERGLSRISCPGPRAREFAIETEKTKKETRILLPPRSGGETTPRALPQMSRASPRSAGTRRSPARLRSLASPALRDTKGKGEQPGRSGGWRRLPSTWAGMSRPHRVDCRSGSTMVSRSGDSM